MQDTLLVELLTEELPPKALQRLSLAFAQSIKKSLDDGGFTTPESQLTSFATPRRLALAVSHVRAQSPDREVIVKGPSVAAGLNKEGQPAPALLGFARKCGVGPEAFERFHDGKQDVFIYRQTAAGLALGSQVQTWIEEALKRLPIPKMMRWGDTTYQFVRPVHGLIVLHGANALPATVLGVRSGTATRGHRFMGERVVEVAHADGYAQVLADKGSVIASFEARREAVRVALAAAAAEIGGARAIEDEALLDEVTALVEHPTVYVGTFEPEFLAVPQECLILTMKQNQKYFPLLDADGRLLNKFLIVSNIKADIPDNITGGNARVVRARLSDAKFFFDQDRKQRLDARLEKLAAVVYHNKLGTQFQRIERLVKLAGAIARQLHGDVAATERAALLAKADLVTDMVGEFPELQGIMGEYYARHDGEADGVAQAIEQHYRPRFAGDTLPQGNIACAVSLADKLDALAGFFAIGEKPTGDKDPFGLRRAALGVLRILIETPLPLDLHVLLQDAAAGFAPEHKAADAVPAMLEFMLERLRNLLREQGAAPEQVDAVLALAPTRIDQVFARLGAVKEFVALPEALALAAANKRIVNILKKTEGPVGEPDLALLQEPAEKALFHAVVEVAPSVRSLLANADYTGALKALAGLRAAVDTFFDEVMVMDEEPLTRQNRLALLKQLAGLMNGVADISRLVLN